MDCMRLQVLHTHTRPNTAFIRRSYRRTTKLMLIRRMRVFTPEG